MPDPALDEVADEVDEVVDVLVVGAGPTGLALAAELHAHGVRPRVVDRHQDRVHESRALALQPRTLEVLAGRGISDRLVARGNRAVRLRVHTARRTVEVPLFDIGLDDTSYPYLLFLSQAETESVLGEHLRSGGVTLERGVELVGLTQDDDGVTCRVRDGSGTDRTVRARYVVGCDGARSTVRRLTGIAFRGAAYPQHFVLADLEADVLDPGAAHVFLSGDGPLLFFPLGRPTMWRLIAMRPRGAPLPPDGVTLADLQRVVDARTGGTVGLRDPEWMTDFRLQHRGAERYRAGRVLLAGDAAHVHSPAGAQGMNTGIQDAVDLGWKLALVTQGRGVAALLDTYEAERAPVGRAVLRLTDRAFAAATSSHPLVRLARTHVAPVVLEALTHAHGTRARAFRTVAELRIRYARSPLSTSGGRSRRAPRPGDRLPDALVLVAGGTSTLHRRLHHPGFHLLLWDPDATCPPQTVRAVETRYPGVVTVHRLGPRRSGNPVQDLTGHLARRLGLPRTRPAYLLVRPDGHVAHRGDGDLRPLRRYLETWLVAAS
ncbi:FAD-dependent monooxygenase [Cellulomonas aerilata]|uniref:FAD-binding monooxygenase n=1 Tax=Cellulomonas aerilata TaxID=515326 RepID=A0A512D9F1_9CELL|nr:FAD-dependent monooxygenase [Cellulomonas aerilata]GEO33112.1 FAD-binding monooxygenase [Cellulomonas aerilata]